MVPGFYVGVYSVRCGQLSFPGVSGHFGPNLFVEVLKYVLKKKPVTDLTDFAHVSYRSTYVSVLVRGDCNEIVFFENEGFEGCPW